MSFDSDDSYDSSDSRSDTSDHSGTSDTADRDLMDDASDTSGGEGAASDELYHDGGADAGGGESGGDVPDETVHRDGFSESEGDPDDEGEDPNGEGEVPDDGSDENGSPATEGGAEILDDNNAHEGEHDDEKDEDGDKEDDEEEDDKDGKSKSQEASENDEPDEATKAEVREKSEYSDEINDNIKSTDELEVYQKAGLKEEKIDGKACLVRDDIDWDQKDEFGRTNRERVDEYLSPINKSGDTVELHHIGQKDDSPFAELTMEEHRGKDNDTILHDKTKQSEIDRSAFNAEKHSYWKSRAGKEDES